MCIRDRLSSAVVISCSTRKHTRISQEELPVDDGFLDMISKSQSRRLDDQRTTFPDSAATTPDDSHLAQGGSGEEDDLFETLWRLQGARIDDQRCDMPSADSVLDQDRWEEGEPECLSSDELFDMIFECCLLYTSPSPRDATLSRMPSSA